MRSQDLDFGKKIADAVKSGNPDDFGSAMQEYADAVQDSIMHDVEGRIQARDVDILKARGKNDLTEKEKKFYDALRESIRTKAPLKMAIDKDSYTNTMPETLIDHIFDDLKQNHPLLAAMGFQNTTGQTKMYFNSADTPVASWGELTGAITNEISGKFTVETMGLSKLSSFIPIPLAMIDVGYERLDQYVRTLLTESIAFGCESGAIKGTGKDMPIGMVKQVGAGVSVTGGVYPDKTATKVTDFDATTLGGLVAKITQNGKRPAGQIALGGGIGLDHLGKAHDDTQNVVEIMGDAAGELAQRLHLLSLPQPLLRIPAARDVELAGEEIDQRPVGIEDRADEKRVPEG